MLEMSKCWNVGNVGNVENMAFIFRGAAEFNQDLIWNTERVIDLSNMFDFAMEFNKPLDWNTSSVTKGNVFECFQF